DAEVVHRRVAGLAIQLAQIGFGNQRQNARRAAASEADLLVQLLKQNAVGEMTYRVELHHNLDGGRCRGGAQKSAHNAQRESRCATNTIDANGLVTARPSAARSSTARYFSTTNRCVNASPPTSMRAK